MGFIDDKSEIFDQVALFGVLNNLPTKSRVTSSIESVASKSKNLLPFMMDLLSTVCYGKEKKRSAPPSFIGSSSSIDRYNRPQESPKKNLKCETIRIVVEILIEFFPALIRIIKAGIIKAVKESLLCPTDFTIPNPTPTVVLDMDQVDYSKILKVDPTRFPGTLLFGEIDRDMNLFVSQLISTGTNQDTWKNILDFNFDPNTETMSVKINDSYAGKPFDTFLEDFINSIELINFNNFVPTLINQINGSLDFASPNFDFDFSYDKERVDKLIEKVLNSDQCEENFFLDDSFFEFTNDELLDIEKKANERASGSAIIDYSCTPYISRTSTETLENFYNDVSGTSGTESKKIVREYLDTIITEATSATAGSIDSGAQKKAFSLKLALSLPKVFTNIIFTPKIVIMKQLSNKLIKNTIIEGGSSYDYAVYNKVFFDFVVRESLAALLEIIFNQIKREIAKLIGEFVANLVAEATDKRVQQILSLTGGFIARAGLSVIPVPNTSDFV